METEHPSIAARPFVNSFNALAVLVPGFICGVLIVAWHMSTQTDRWISAGSTDAIDVNALLPEIYFAALLTAQMAERIRCKESPETLLAAVVTTTAVWVSSTVFFSLGLVFMYAGVPTMIATVCVLLLAILSGCAWAMRHLPVRRPSWFESVAKMALSVFMLAWLLPAWQTVSIKAMSPEERHVAALAEFGNAYTVASDVLRTCTAIRDITGDLTQLIISPRRNRVESTPNWDDTYFDFDYGGTLGSGRITINIQHLKSVEPGNADGYPARTASLVGREGNPETLVFIYPGYSKSWVNRICSLPIPHDSGTE